MEATNVSIVGKLPSNEKILEENDKKYNSAGVLIISKYSRIP
jgi:hypothetical protein